MGAVSVGSTAITRPYEADERNRYWILPKMQARLIAWLVMTSAVVATTVAWAILLVVWSPMGGHLTGASISADADKLFWDACVRVFATTGLLIVIFGLVALLTGIVISHKVAGPLHRMALVASQVAQGQIGDRVAIRRGDYVQDFALKFNEMLDCIQARARRQEIALDAVHDRLAAVENELSGAPERSLVAEKQLQESLRIIREARLGGMELDASIS